MKKHFLTDFESNLRKVFAKIPDLEIDLFVQTDESPAGHDFLLIVDMNGKRYKLIIVLRDNGQPRIARETGDRIVRAMQKSHAEYGLFAAPYVSERSAALCQENGIGYIDLSGNCFVNFDTVYIEKSGSSNRFRPERQSGNISSPKASRIVRVLLSNKQKEWKISDLSCEAGVSYGQVSNVKKLMNDLEWLDNTCRGIKLSNPEAVFQEWVDQYSYKRFKVFKFSSHKPVPEIEWEVSKYARLSGTSFALTSMCGAKRYLKGVRSSKVAALVDCESSRVCELFPFRKVERNENLLLIVPNDLGCFYQSVSRDTVIVASPIQVYLDILYLWGECGTSEHILETMIKPVWHSEKETGTQLFLPT